MNPHTEKGAILYRITLQNVPYMDFNLLVLMSFEVTTVTHRDRPNFASASCIAE